MSKELPKDVIDQIERTDFHYKRYIDNLPIEEVLQENDNVRIGILKSWGEIMETYFKAALRVNDISWEQLKADAGHNLVALYGMLDINSKTKFEEELMGVREEFISNLTQEIMGLESPDMEKMMGFYLNGTKKELSSAVYEAMQAWIEGGHYYVCKKSKNGLKGKKYSFGAILNMISMIKVADFRYADRKYATFNDNFMLMVRDCVKSLHVLTRINRLTKAKEIQSIRNKSK